MNIKSEIFMAWRYLKPKRNAVSVITCISIVGVTLGVAVLIVVLAVMTGFTDLMKEKLLETTAHIQICDYITGHIPDPGKVMDEVRKCGAEGAPVVTQPVLAQRGDKFMPKSVIGVDPAAKCSAMNLAKAVRAGKFSLERNEVLVSNIISDELNLSVGGKLLLHAPNRLAKMVKVKSDGTVSEAKNKEVYLPSEYRVSGIFNFGKYDFDKNVLFMNLDDADELFGVGLFEP